MAWREQQFTAPGTWTNPGTVVTVEVWCVGGGGGGAGPAGGFNSGGGGAVRWAYLPVSGPAPVVVGAGGTAGGPLAYGGVGGDSSFNGPTGLVSGGGGAAVGSGVPAPLAPRKNAPPVGGGGGQSDTNGEGIGAFGTPASGSGGGGAGGPARLLRYAPNTFTGASGVLIPGIGYFGGGAYQSAGNIGIHGAGQYIGSVTGLPANGIANSGGGGAGSPTGGTGGSGFVVVRWWE